MFKRVLYAYLRGNKDRKISFSRPQWDKDKVLILYLLNVIKATQQKEVRDILKEVYKGDLPVISFSKKDAFYSVKPEEWFTYDKIPKAGHGKNILGKILKDISLYVDDLDEILKSVVEKYNGQLSHYKIFGVPILKVVKGA